MDSNYYGNPDKKGSEHRQEENISLLVLHNDDINTFEYVMETLEEVCTHSLLQAEQCAMITHYNGKCEILRGETSELKVVRRELISRGLKATIE
ncbi:MAG: ATP-dependent Clp protease adaptor ClpS [Bacteroidales bacterium]|nr:ATP-dependent Clp protease adaptor ClpS [Bacteroidales bacterium]